MRRSDRAALERNFLNDAMVFKCHQAVFDINRHYFNIILNLAFFRYIGFSRLTWLTRI